jgi:hypothetical protein
MTNSIFFFIFIQAFPFNYLMQYWKKSVNNAVRHLQKHLSICVLIKGYYSVPYINFLSVFINSLLLCCLARSSIYISSSAQCVLPYYKWGKGLSSISLDPACFLYLSLDWVVQYLIQRKDHKPSRNRKRLLVILRIIICIWPMERALLQYV